MELLDCLGRVYQPLKACKECRKDEFNLKCPEYRPFKQVIINVEEIRPYLDCPLEEFTDSPSST